MRGKAFTPIFAGEEKQSQLLKCLQEVLPFFGQGVDAPPAPARGLHEPALPEVAEVLIDGRQRYPEPVRHLVPVDGPSTYLLQDPILRRAENTHAEPQWRLGYIAQKHYNGKIRYTEKVTV